MVRRSSFKSIAGISFLLGEYNSEVYRFGFNGKENDNETYGNGNVYDYGFRIYDPLLGRFLSVDPLTKSFPFFTPYQFSGNRPIACLDMDGLEDIYYLPSFLERMGQLVLEILISTKLGNEFINEFQDPNKNKGYDAFVISSPMSGNPASKGSSGTQGTTESSYSPNSTFFLNGVTYNVYNEIIKIRENRKNNIENTGEIYDWVKGALSEEVLFSDGLGSTIQKCRSIILINLNSTPLNEAKISDLEGKKHNKLGNIKIMVKALGHEIKAHANSLMQGEEGDPVRQHKSYQGISEEGYDTPDSQSRKFSGQVDEKINQLLNQ